MDGRDFAKDLTLPSLGQYQGPPALLNPLVVLISSRAVTEALGMWDRPKADWVAV